jgi:hypothetical protein
VSTVTQLLPIFPLDSVLLPGAPMPLHIFEPRYRELLADVWGAHDQAPRQAGFGIISVTRAGQDRDVRGPGRHQHRTDGGDPAGGEHVTATGATNDLALVGTFASIVEVEPYADGRSDLLTIGSRRFRVVEIEPTGKPYLRAQVEWLAEEHGGVSESLADAARTRCTRYLLELAEIAGRDLPAVSFASDPVTLSYQVAGRMRLSNSERQGLLEAATAAQRLLMALRLLRREIVLLDRTRSVPVSPGLLKLETRPN